MNGELYQLARLVLYVKESMRDGSEKEFKLGKYENRLYFTFLPVKKIFMKQAEECFDASSWYKALKKRGIKDIKLVNFFEENNIKYAGFSNAAKQGFFTEYTDGVTTFWAAKWEYDSIAKMWTIYYKEFQWTESLPETYVYPECRDNFEKSLQSIEELANKLGFENFAKIFREAYEILTNEADSLIPEWTEGTMPELRGEGLKLFLAASKADVFGAMGSWNDSPPYYAHEKGLTEDYNRLSHNLYVSIKQAVMNAVNW